MAKASSGSENIIHVAGVRLRIIGSGNLQMRLLTLDEVRSFNMLPLPMSATTDREPTRIGNMRSQRVQVEFKVLDYDEWFKISKIVVFAKVSGTSLPG